MRVGVDKSLQEQYRSKRLARQKRYNERHHEKVREQAREYDRRTRQKHLMANRRRRSVLKGTGGDLTTTEWEELVEECGGMCVICHAPYEHMDHIIPLSKGGKHTLSNVQPLCAKCNLSKGAKS